MKPGASYIPVTYMTGLPLCLDSKTYTFKGKNLTLWESNSLFTYPILLVSAYHGMDWGDIRARWNVPDDYTIMGDSGGFQNMTLQATLNPIKVLRWQEKYCQIGMTFDLPIFGGDSVKRKKEKQNQTAINAAIAYNNRENKDLKLYAVFQGHTVEDQEYMLECYNNNIPLDKFDGIAIGGLVPVSGNTEKLIKVLTTFCYNVKEYNKPLHFFGLSGNKIVPYILYLADKFNLKITFDSSSYTAGGRRREFWKGNGLEKIKVMETNFDKMPCDCPVCSHVKDWKEFQKNRSIPGGLISLHNLYQTIQYVKSLDLNKLNLNKNYKRFIDVMTEFGIAKAFTILEPITYNSTTQMNLFKW